MRRHPSPILTGTLILTATGLLSRLIGFAYRIYLSRIIGAEAMGIFQLIAPVSGICFALCCGPLQTAISRFCAQEGNRCPGTGSHPAFSAGLLLSEAMAFITAVILFHYADFCAGFLLGDIRAALPLRFLALSVPVSAAHAAINGYYYGRRQTAIPATAQLAEQCVRVAAVMILADWLTRGHRQTGAPVAAFGLVIGELAALTVSFFALRFTLFREKLQQMPSDASPHATFPKDILAEIPRLLSMAVPLTANRLIIGLLQSMEAASLPLALQKHGASAAEALSLYGILTGMALPFIFFPSALTNSVSVMLLPSVAEAQSAKDHGRIRRTSRLTVSFCFYLGIFCTGVFVLCGRRFGQVFFADPLAGEYIAILSWLCPFLYLSTTAASILNGMGHTILTFLIHLCGLLIRLLTVVLFVPRFGMTAYLLGMLAGGLTDAGLCLLALRGKIRLSFSVFRQILRPMAAVYAAGRIASPCLLLAQQNSSLTSIFSIGICCCLMLALYVLLLYVTRRL